MINIETLPDEIYWGKYKVFKRVNDKWKYMDTFNLNHLEAKDIMKRGYGIKGVEDDEDDS